MKSGQSWQLKWHPSQCKTQGLTVPVCIVSECACVYYVSICVWCIHVCACMYAHMYMCMYVYTCVLYMCINMCACMDCVQCIYVCTFVYCACVHAYLYMCVCVYLCMCICVLYIVHVCGGQVCIVCTYVLCICVYMCIFGTCLCVLYILYVCTHVYHVCMYVRTHMHMCLHAHMCVCTCVWQSRLKHIDLRPSLHDAEAFVFSKETQFVRSTGPQWP